MAKSQPGGRQGLAQGGIRRHKEAQGGTMRHKEAQGGTRRHKEAQPDMYIICIGWENNKQNVCADVGSDDSR